MLVGVGSLLNLIGANGGRFPSTSTGIQIEITFHSFPTSKTVFIQVVLEKAADFVHTW